ncbi:hypothetical protein cand_027840 [Cryptosporidium andersoni]|uniref:Transcription factor CBF/NF-Y/archaeal histone domain-containing protein n=1 Tax=Cryptosporidium andersoni TaxID=117008 RepID=A0A1J4MTJ8_9CRYT|nr:hypothetical protein cand_027840 [Cryptosporidium andersoni]
MSNEIAAQIPSYLYKPNPSHEYINSPHMNYYNIDTTGSCDDSELSLPINNIGRMMRVSLPSCAKISRESKVLMQHFSKEFIGSISSKAGELCSLNKRKVLSGDDIIKALSECGFGNYVETLDTYLAFWRGSKSKNQHSGIKNNQSYNTLESVNSQHYSNNNDNLKFKTIQSKQVNQHIYQNEQLSKKPFIPYQYMEQTNEQDLYSSQQPNYIFLQNMKHGSNNNQNAKVANNSDNANSKNDLNEAYYANFETSNSVFSPKLHGNSANLRSSTIHNKIESEISSKVEISEKSQTLVTNIHEYSSNKYSKRPCDNNYLYFSQQDLNMNIKRTRSVTMESNNETVDCEQSKNIEDLLLTSNIESNMSSERNFEGSYASSDDEEDQEDDYFECTNLEQYGGNIDDIHESIQSNGNSLRNRLLYVSDGFYG